MCIATTGVQSGAGGAAEPQRCFRRRLGAFLYRNRSRTDTTLRFYLDHPLLAHVLSSERAVLADITVGHTFRVFRIQSVDDTDTHTLFRVHLRSPSTDGGVLFFSGQMHADRVLAECVEHVHTAIREHMAAA